jgi:hypothetical protein
LTAIEELFMDTPFHLKAITALTGLLMVGEAVALLLGALQTTGDSGGWLSLKNGLLLQVDIITGVGLILIALLVKDFLDSPIFYVVMVVAVMTHVFRDWEYVNGVQNMFLANLNLLILNNVRLAGLFLPPLLG